MNANMLQPADTSMHDPLHPAVASVEVGMERVHYEYIVAWCMLHD